MKATILAKAINRNKPLCLACGSHAVVGYLPQDRCLSLFIALRWMQRPERVMMWLTENIQACLWVFRRAQHLWIVRDILHHLQGVFMVFVLWPTTEVHS